MSTRSTADSPRAIIPTEIRTARCLLRPWRAEDAAALHPILEANFSHLGPWIPARVATPAPVPVLAERLAGFGKDFAEAREWRYGLFSADGADVLGEIGLFPRSETGRVPYGDADRVELGYWLRVDRTGQGLVNEGARAVLDAIATVRRFAHVEIRCDARNTASSAVPRRLGFTLATTIVEPPATDGGSPVHLQVWSNERQR